MKRFSKFRRTIQSIHFVDKCLLVFLAILLMQSAYTLFFGKSTSQEANSIDVVVRTSAAAIFGYFISANFHRKSSKNKSDPSSKTLQCNRTADSDKTGSPPSCGGTNLELRQPVVPPSKKKCCDYLQDIIVAVIGMVALCILLLCRNFVEITPAAAGTISQFRDFISGCIGFLIGCATGGKEVEK